MSSAAAVAIIALFTIAQGTLAQSGLSISLKVNNETTDTIHSGEPVVLSMVLSNPHSEYAMHQNRLVDRYLRSLEDSLQARTIDQERFDDESSSALADKLDVPTVQIGHPDRPWYDQVALRVMQAGQTDDEWTAEHCNGRDEPVLQISGSQRVFSKWWLSGRFQPGTYEISTRIDSTWSNPVQLTIRRSELPGVEQLAPAELLNIGSRFLDCGDHTRALFYSQALLRRVPDAIGGMILKADALVLADELSEALAVYQEALDAFNKRYPDEYEAPAYLLGRIAWVEGMLGKDR